MKSPHFSFPVLSAFALSLMAVSPLKATLIDTDGSVPATMNAGGSSGNPAEYIIGAVTDPPSSPSTVTHTGNTTVGSSTSWNNLTIQNGWKLTTTGNGNVSSTTTSANNHVVVSGTGSAWNVQGTRFYLGNGSNNSLLVTNGASFSLTGASPQLQIGVGANAMGNSFTISNGSSVTQSAGTTVYVGYGAGASGNSFVVKNGASYTLVGNSILIGAQAANTNNNHIDVSGANTRFTVGTGGIGTFTIGKTGVTGNYALVEDGALLQLADPSRFTIAADNYLRLDNGYLALSGNQTTKLTSMISAGNFQIWDGASWQTQKDSSAFQITYFTSGQAAQAEAYSGYTGLGNYTLLYYSSVPEPGAAALLALGAGLFAFIRRRKGTAPLA